MSDINKLLEKADVLIAGINDEQLSLYAKGLLTFMCLNPGLKSIKQLRQEIGRTAEGHFFDFAIKELINQGYMETKSIPALQVVR